MKKLLIILLIPFTFTCVGQSSLDSLGNRTNKEYKELIKSISLQCSDKVEAIDQLLSPYYRDSKIPNTALALFESLKNQMDSLIALLEVLKTAVQQAESLYGDQRESLHFEIDLEIKKQNEVMGYYSSYVSSQQPSKAVEEPKKKKRKQGIHYF